jgi:MOSC domain-containing protein YiiM
MIDGREVGYSEITGRVFQISRSRGGVPKTGVHEALINFLGVEGDAHSNPGIHGGPERAVCLYSLEWIDALQKEGHPVFPGALGENLTISGLPWEEVGPSDRLVIGEQVLLEFTAFTTPCNTIRACFKGGEIARISQRMHPGWSRLYARVLQPGSVKVGDSVRIIKT